MNLNPSPATSDAVSLGSRVTTELTSSVVIDATLNLSDAGAVIVAELVTNTTAFENGDAETVFHTL